MKYIRKGSEPEILAGWKRANKRKKSLKFDDLDPSVRSNLKDQLLKEQSFLCCYCEQRIAADASHIEHIKPRSQYPQLEVEYLKLTCSCQGESDPKEPKHCGASKGGWYDVSRFISPLKPDCEKRFRYLGDGSILPNNENDDAARETIDRLGLDIRKLRDKRREAVRAVDTTLDGLSGNDIKRYVQTLFCRNEEGQFWPFYTTIRYHITNYYPEYDPGTEIRSS